VTGYRYFSESAEEITGIPSSEFVKKGLAFSFSLWNHEAATFLFPVFEEVSGLVQAVSTEDRPFIRFNYSMLYHFPKGDLLLYQQNIPLAFNDAGLPYLVLAVISDITHYANGTKVHYRTSLAKPGETKVLLEGRLGAGDSPLTDREQEIARLLAMGLDANEIAGRLFISEGTVRTHRKNILEKTGARNSVHLVRMSVANGWI
jgi:DNA-binding CsgD family transcriptional regulator